MATIKTYKVKRAGFARSKVDGKPVHINRHNQDQIPHLLTKSDIKARIESGAFEEIDTGVEETTAEDVKAAELLESKAGVRGGSRPRRES